MTRLTSTGRLRLLSFAVLFGTFFAGSLAGAAFTRVVNADESAPRQEPKPQSKEQAPEKKKRRSIFDELQLTPQQDSQIRAIMARTEPKTDSMWHEFRPRIRAVIDSANAQIDSVLEPQQREQLQKWRQERRERERQRRENGDRDNDRDRDKEFLL